MLIYHLINITILTLRHFEVGYDIDHLQLINNLFIHYVVLWPILGRFYYITKIIKISFLFTKENIANIKQDSTNDSHSKLFTDKRNQYLPKVIYIPLLLIFFICFGLSLIPYTRCLLYSLNLFDITMLNCEDYIQRGSSLYLTLILIKIVTDVLILLFFVYKLKKLCEYKIKNDQFKVKFELICLFLIWYTFHNVYHYIILFYPYFEKHYICKLFILCIEVLLFVILYGYITIKKRKINKSEFFLILNNFDSFMKNPIYFIYFKDYIKKNAEEEYNYISFWIEYHFYKSQFNHITLEENKDRAYNLFIEYFVNSIEREKSSAISKIRFNSKMNSSNTKSSNVYAIDFSVEITEKVEEAFNDNFNMEADQLDELFDDAYHYINNKLYNRYLAMFRNEDEYNKLEKLLCYIDFDFSK